MLILLTCNLISNLNSNICFLLFLIDIYIKYPWIIPLKDKKSITITNVSQNLLKESDRKPSNIWADKGSEF